MRILFFPHRKIKLVLIGLLLILVSLLGYVVYLEQNQSQASRTSAAHYQGSTNQKMIALTFNVDWGEDYVPQLLEILREAEVKATFFITGKWASKHPELVKAIDKDGHDVGNHGHGHKHLKNLSDAQLRQDITEAEKILQGITGRKPKLFAPAYGEVDERITGISNQLGYEVIMWSLDTIDWQNPDVSVIIKRVVPRIHNDAIILMHPTKPTVQALPDMIKALKAEGYKMVPVSRLIAPAKENDGKPDVKKPEP